MKRLSRALAVAALFLLSVAGLAQTIGGRVAGRVLSEQEQPLAGAEVAARNVNTAMTRTAKADASGAYWLPELPAGIYDFTVVSQGFATEVRPGVKIFIGQQLTLDFKLKVAAVAETVTVEAAVPVVEDTKSSIGTTITRREIDQLPLPDRDFESLAFLAPGIVPSVTEATGISGAGSSGSSNTFLIDGVSNDQTVRGDSRGDYSPDAIAEYEVLSSAYSAQYGQASGAIINVLTRSGGNDLHGRASAYYRADALTASDPFAGGGNTSSFDQWIPSAFLSGPIMRDKAFFFASFEDTLLDETAVVGVNPATLEALGLGTDTTFPKTLREPRAVLKLDYHPANNQTLTFRFRLDNPTTTNDGVGQDAGGGAVVTDQAGFTSTVENTDYALMHSWVISPQALNEARFQFARQTNDFVPNCPGCAMVIRPSLVSGKLSNQPQSAAEDRYQFLDSLSFSMGDHFLKAGVDYSNIKVNAFVPQNFDGAFVFTTDAPYNAADPTTFPFLWQGGSGDPNINLKNNIVALFIQDQWKVLPNLTLNLGLRWDYEDQIYVKHDWQNFGPRVHFAWDPTNDGKTSVRGGFGVYYDQVFLNVGLIASIFEPGRFNSTTILHPGYPDPYSGANGTPLPLPGNISVLDRATTTPYKNVGSLGVQRELGPNMAASLDLVYARSYHLLNIRDANAPIDGVRPDPNVGLAFDIQTEGKAEYEALQLGFQRRFSDCFSAQLAYTLANNESDTDGHQSFPSDSYNRSADYGPSLNDIRNTLNVAVNYAGPWGVLLGVGGTFLSGAPYNIITGTDDNGDGMLTDRPEGVGHNAARGNSSWTVNAQIGKVFAVGPTQLQVLVEVLNVFNHINKTGYVGNLSSPAYGQPTGTANTLGLGPRSVQVGLRFDF